MIYDSTAKKRNPCFSEIKISTNLSFLIPLMFMFSWSYPFAVLENYELSEGRSPDETTLSDITAVLSQRKDMCNKMV